MIQIHDTKVFCRLQGFYASIKKQQATLKSRAVHFSVDKGPFIDGAEARTASDDASLSERRLKFPVLTSRNPSKRGVLMP
jgi:hypothetical protein